MKYRIIEFDDYYLVENKSGVTISYAKNSGVNLLFDDGYAFKDLNKNGLIDPYEDWRLDEEDRINDLVKKLTIEEIAGLMLYSPHLAVSSGDDVFSQKFRGTYNGKSYTDSRAHIWQITDEQKKMINENKIRHLLLTIVDDGETAARWNNQIQAYCESLGKGIPANISSDPRHGVSGKSEFNAGASNNVSNWPEPVGIAATFDPRIAYEYGKIVAKEYRAMGITTSLSPQIDLATDPRWMRFSGSFSEDTQLATDMAQAFCDGLQTTNDSGWGEDSVNAMVKHWPGGGTGESGRDAHYAHGKFAVYPGDNFKEHIKPFSEGAFKLQKGTKKAAAVMPYYTISYNQSNQNVGNSFNRYLITDLLRETYDYDGVVCTDWGITSDVKTFGGFSGGKCWGLEKESVEERHFQALIAGVDQFGGNNQIDPIMKAFEKGCTLFGEVEMRQRFQASAKRLLKNIFQCGLFDNPYTNPDKAKKVVANQAFVEKGFQIQQQSVVLLKNKNDVLPIKKGKKVYLPNRRIAETTNWFGQKVPAHFEKPISSDEIQGFYQVVNNPDDADFSIICIDSPNSIGGYSENGYEPISLQYEKYVAKNSRNESIAQDPHDQIPNRSYRNKSSKPSNEADLEIVKETVRQMNGKPVIVVANTKNPFVVKEFESEVDSILLHFQVEPKAFLRIISGQTEPKGLLPFQMPKDMSEVEKQFEDVGLDMDCYTDSENNKYDFGFGLTYHGIINDERTKRYKRKEVN
ncbi:glycoside hydrolase family 3 N-terminal domain-containing protein [Enterococcus sp.]|uniref:glycoside hydrolase family 3 protein n=1 Tax=Enterococcus sp. TaxID=35783 RepID=UPI0025C419D8|nr:glycoside hydrolase family 3 N-terminal domain-containing protein [Enterococcus sp.]